MNSGISSTKEGGGHFSAKRNVLDLAAKLVTTNFKMFATRFNTLSDGDTSLLYCTMHIHDDMVCRHPIIKHSRILLILYHS